MEATTILTRGGLPARALQLLGEAEQAGAGAHFLDEMWPWPPSDCHCLLFILQYLSNHSMAGRSRSSQPIIAALSCSARRMSWQYRQ